MRPPLIHELGDGRLPIGVSPGTIGVDARWWIEGARRLEAAGYAGIWTWDHLAARGRVARPVLESWTMITAAATATQRVAIGTHVLNVMSRHPAVLARMAATLQAIAGGRLVLGLGIGGSPGDHEPFGLPLPPVAERVERLRETVAVMRALWTGSAVTLDLPHYPLREAVALPVPEPPPPILIAGQSTGGARLAGELGDGWTTRPDLLARCLPAFLDGLAASGRRRADVSVIVSIEGGRSGEDALAGSPWVEAPDEALAECRAAGVDGVIVTPRTTADVDRLVAATERW